MLYVFIKSATVPLRLPHYTDPHLSWRFIGCENYMPYGDLMPNSDCNFVCPGDSTELCGAGNRMIVYENSAATPPSTSTCITWRDQWSFGNNVLRAVPKIPGTGPTTKLFAIPTNPFTDPIYYTIISVSVVCSKQSLEPV